MQGQDQEIFRANNKPIQESQNKKKTQKMKRNFERKKEIKHPHETSGEKKKRIGKPKFYNIFIS